MICETCHEKMYRGIVFTGQFSKEKIKDGEARFRTCVNPQCVRENIIENFCTLCQIWTDTQDGISQPCKECGGLI